MLLSLVKKKRMKYVRSAQWRRMTRGDDRWQAFYEASCAWRKDQAAQAEDANADPEAAWEDQPHSSDAEQEILDDATIMDAAR